MDNSIEDIVEGIRTVEELKRVRAVLLKKIEALGGTDCRNYHISISEAKEYDICIGSLLACILGMYQEIRILKRKL
tara:strand:+ start:537 stop:764 length:228 start_codon:yes stop_codon:yes gene_type:complete